MKKLIFCIIVAAFLFSSAFADIVPVPQDTQDCCATITYADETFWAVDNGSLELIGTISTDEKLPVLNGRTDGITFIRGILDDSIIRVKAMARITETGGCTSGLAPCSCATVCILDDCLASVNEITLRRTGMTACAGSIIASTLWRKCDTVSHIFWTTQEVIPVGYVTIHNSVLTIWQGDFDGDGQYELGFKAGIGNFRTVVSVLVWIQYVKPQYPCQSPYFYGTVQ